MLKENYGDEYNPSDVEKLAKLLINNDKKVIYLRIMLDPYKNYSYIQA